MMEQHEKFNEAIKKVGGLMVSIFAIFLAITSFFAYFMVDPNLSAFRNTPTVKEYIALEEEEGDFDKIENGIHIRTGFVDGEGLMAVVNNCTNCHSAKLVTQNRMSKERWLATIRWMQETQNLWDLGTNEEAIVTYLATYYAPTKKGRRQNLSNIEWYELE